MKKEFLKEIKYTNTRDFIFRLFFIVREEFKLECETCFPVKLEISFCKILKITNKHFLNRRQSFYNNDNSERKLTHPF